MDPLRMIIALVPLAAYLLLLGVFNLRRRPVVLSGGRDWLLLGFGLFGLALVGPLEQFLLTEWWAFRFGGYAWLMLICLYLLSVSLAIMMGPPRIVIYNSDVEMVRPAISQIVHRLDEHARWAGDSVVLPTIGMQLYIERYAPLRNIQLRAVGYDQPYGAWTVLERELREELKQFRTDRSFCGPLFVLTAAVVLCLIATTYLRDQGEIARSLQEMLRQ